MRFWVLFIGFCWLHWDVFSQDSLLKMLPDGDYAKGEPVIASFKTTRLINAHSIEVVRRGQLDFRITHRFGDAAGSYGGPNTFFGFDNSTDIRIALEYGISDRFCAGFGRSKFNQLLDGYLKYRVLRQTMDNKVPVSVTVLASTGFSTTPKDPHNFPKYIHRFSYFFETLIARKFSNRLSVQIAPAWLYRNYIYDTEDSKSLISIGLGLRFKITKRFVIIADYYHLFSSFRNSKKDALGNKQYYPPLGLGLEFETGGHIFSVNFTNAPAIVENSYLAYTQSNWLRGQFRFGFNISRQFSLIKQQKPTPETTSSSSHF